MLEVVEKYVAEGRKTDYIMPLWLPLAPLLSTFGFAIALVALIAIGRRFDGDFVLNAFVAVLLFLLTLILISVVYVLYKWLWRRNEHFKRQRLLFKSVTQFLKSRGYDTSELESICMEMDVEDVERSAVLWALATFLPYVGEILLYYIFHIINKDFYKHERREDRFLAAVSSMVPFSYSRSYTLPDRNTLKYLLLSLVTLGLFMAYWAYVLTKDVNEHFMEHRRWERRMLEALRSI